MGNECGHEARTSHMRSKTTKGRAHIRTTQSAKRGLIVSLRHAFRADQVIHDPEALTVYSYDATGEHHQPDAVVLPTSRDDVVAAVRLARQFNIPIVGRGSGSNLSGGTLPLGGGLVVAFTRMRQVLAIDWEQGWVDVQPGVVNNDLQRVLESRGFFYPPDPSSHAISTLGGNVAENSGGAHCVKYGVTTHYVRAMELVLGSGEVVELSTESAQEGYDLRGLVVGSEGTLGLVTKIRLAITPKPETRATMLAAFRDLGDALACAAALIGEHINPSALELLDQPSLAVIEPFAHVGFPTGAGGVLLIEVDGTVGQVNAQIPRVADLVSQWSPIQWRIAESVEEANAFWRARRAHYGAAARMAPHLWVQDVTVPRPQLGAMMQDVLDIGRRHGLRILTAAHVGDGNLHPNIPYDPNDPQDVARLKAADREILEACVARGGSITGEHGVGIDKLPQLPLMYTSDELAVMIGVKHVFDLPGMLNPNKAICAPNTTADVTQPLAEADRVVPTRFKDLVDAVKTARHERRRLAVRGACKRGVLADESTVLDMRRYARIVEIDVENLTCTVEAGVLARDLKAALDDEGLELPGLADWPDETVGGLVASNASSWLTLWRIDWRQSLLAVDWIDGLGRCLRFGRKTVKNVAGYDMVKLAVGSWGDLGVLARLTFRLWPRRLVGRAWVVSYSDPKAAIDGMVRIATSETTVKGFVHVAAHDSVPCTIAAVTDDASEEPALPHLLQSNLGKAGTLTPSRWESADQVQAWRRDILYRSLTAGYGHRRLWRSDDWQHIVGAGSEFVFYPDTGMCEVLGSASQSVVGDFAVLTRLNEGIRQVLDPDNLWLSGRKGARHSGDVAGKLGDSTIGD